MRLPRPSNLVAAACCLALGGCVGFMPHTAEAIAPATLDDLALGVAADAEALVLNLIFMLGL